MRIADKEKRSPLGLLGLLDIEQHLSASDGNDFAQLLDAQLQTCLQAHLRGSRAENMQRARRHAMLAELCQLGHRVLAFTGQVGRIPEQLPSPPMDEDALCALMEELGHLARVRVWTSQSEQIFAALVKLYPEHPAGHLGQAMLRLEREHYAEAAALFATVQRLAPDNLQALLGMGMLHYLAGKFRLAVDCLTPLRQSEGQNQRIARAILALPELGPYL